MQLNRQLIQKLPKAELHCHLDGSLRVNTIIDLANKHKIKLPTFDPKQLNKILSIGKNIGTLEEYITKFDITLSVMQTSDSLKRTAYELAEDCYIDGVRYLDVTLRRFA